VDDINKFERAKFVEEVKSVRSGNISQIHARGVGEAAVNLGAGRAKKGDPIDYAVGFIIRKKVGDVVKSGDVLFEIHANDKAKLEEARESVLSAFQFSEQSVAPLPLFYE
jgi:pyrimidine-nucleoside phosphorylase